MTTTHAAFAERLNTALTRAGFPRKGKGRQTAVAKAFKVSQASAAKWLYGENFPDTTRFLEIAETLGTTLEWLLHGTGHQHFSMATKDAPTNSSPHWIKVPLLNSWEEARSWKTSVKKACNKKNVQWIWAQSDVGPHSYALSVQGDELAPRFSPGSILIVDPAYEVKDKQIAVYWIASRKEVVCRDLSIDGKAKCLKHFYPGHPALLLTPRDQYCGTVRESRMIFK